MGYMESIFSQNFIIIHYKNIMFSIQVTYVVDPEAAAVSRRASRFAHLAEPAIIFLWAISSHKPPLALSVMNAVWFNWVLGAIRR